MIFPIDMERQLSTAEVIHHVDLVASYQQSTEHQELHSVIDPILLNQKDNERSPKLLHFLQPTHYFTNFFFQVQIKFHASQQ